MARRAAAFRQGDATKLIKAALAAGVPVERLAGVRMAPDGSVAVLFGEPDAPVDSANEWDEVKPK